MVMTDPIADMLTRIRNASNVKHDIVEIPASNEKKAIAKILLEDVISHTFSKVVSTQPSGNLRSTLLITKTQF